MSAVALVAALAVGVRAQDCGTTSVWHPPLTEVRYYPAVTIRHEAVYRHHPAVIVSHPAVVVNHPEVVVNHPAVVVHHDAVVVNHPAVTETHYDEDGNPYEVEISPAWDEEIAPAWDEVVEPAWDEVISPAWDEEVSPAWDELVTPERDEVITPQREEIAEISPGWWEEVPNPCTWTESSTTHGEWGPDPATVPMGQAFNQSRLVTTTTRTLNRNAAGVVMESGVTSATTTETRPATGTGTGGGGSTGGGTSGSGGSGGASQHSIAGPPAPGGTRSFWRDVNGDGLPDEIISAHDPRVGLVLTVEQAGWEDDLSTSWTLEPFRDGDRIVHPGFTWSFETLVVPPSNDPWATMDVIFAPEPGFEYVVWQDTDSGFQNDAARWPATVLDRLPRVSAADISAGSATVTVPGTRTFLSVLSRMSWYVIKLGRWEGINASNPDTWPAPFQKLLTGEMGFDDAVLDDAGDTILDGAQYLGPTITRDQAYRFLITTAADRQVIGQAAGGLAIPVGAAIGAAIAAAVNAAQVAVAITVTAAVLVEVDRRIENRPFSYVVYEMKNALTNQHYVGRTSRVGTMEEVLNTRIAEHAREGKSPGAGWIFSRANAYVTTLGRDPGGYAAMRGREQSVLDTHRASGHIMANQRNGVSPYNLSGRTYYNTSNLMFGTIFAYTGFIPPPGGLSPVLRPILRGPVAETIIIP